MAKSHRSVGPRARANATHAPARVMHPSPLVVCRVSSPAVASSPASRSMPFQASMVISLSVSVPFRCVSIGSGAPVPVASIARESKSARMATLLRSSGGTSSIVPMFRGFPSAPASHRPSMTSHIDLNLA